MVRFKGGKCETFTIIFRLRVSPCFANIKENINKN